MMRPMFPALLLIIVALSLLSPIVPARAAEQRPFPIGYLEMENDPRYEVPRSYAGIEVKPRFRPLDGARLGVRDNRIVGRALGLKFSLERETAENIDDLKARLDRMIDSSAVQFILIDAPSDALTALASHAAGRDVLLFNVAEPDDALRGSACAANLIHVIPSRAMLADALAQFLRFRNWTKILLLQGPLPEDKPLADVFTASARKYGLKIVERRDFVMGTDPRERDQNNMALLTTGADYDVVYVADSLGHFARHLAYQTALPRPLVGAEGLVPSAWHWAWERHGAPQLNQRFEKRAERRMYDRDWAAWAAVKIIVTALAETRASDFATLVGYIKSDKLSLDGYKGTPSSLRSWNNQLRQPIFLGTHNAVIERAPIKGFLHPTQYMDTLGRDRRESTCKP